MTSTQQSTSQHNIRFQKGVLLIGVFLFVIKLIAWWITDSVAVYSDALESIVNIVAGSIALYSLYLSSLPRDANHPYGHGKAEFISSAIEGSLIIVAAVLIVIKAFTSLKETSEVTHIDIGIILIIVAGSTNYVMGFLAVKKGKASKSLALEATGKHLISDTYTTLGIVVALVLIKWTGLFWIDGIVSLLLAFVIGIMGYRILRRSIAGVMDEADSELLEEVVAHINARRIDEWVDLHNLRIIKYGPVLHLDCHLTVPFYYHVQAAHILVDELEKSTREKFGHSVELFVHLDPCQPFSCKLCQLKNCPERKEKMTSILEWNIHNISANKQHRL